MNTVIVKDNDRADYLAACKSEKQNAADTARKIAAQFGLDEDCCAAESRRLERQIVEARQADPTSGKTDRERLESFVGKVLALQRARSGEPYRNSTRDEIVAIIGN